MKWSARSAWSRGKFLRALVLTPAAAVFAACTGKSTSSATPDATGAVDAGASRAAAGSPVATARASAAQGTAATGTPVAQVLQATPACDDGDDDDPTPAQTEGPYFTPNSPERTSLLEPGMPGRRLTVSGYVLTTTCQPVAGALIDFWQCDDAGAYDNVGYRLRGHQFTDENGRYELETIVPGLYPGRTRHIHVKVQAPNGPVLTTQQYFPNEPRNARDGIYRPELEMDVSRGANGMEADFNFILAG